MELCLLPSASVGRGKVIVSLYLFVHIQIGTRVSHLNGGYPIQPRTGEYTHPVMGIPPSKAEWGYPLSKAGQGYPRPVVGVAPVQNWMGVTPHPKAGSGYPIQRGGTPTRYLTPPPTPRLATRRAVCLLRSRRTSLFPNFHTQNDG